MFPVKRNLHKLKEMRGRDEVRELGRWRVRENVRNTGLRNHWRQDHTLSQRQQAAWRNKGEGMSRQDVYKMLEMNSYTVFVDNLPM